LTPRELESTREDEGEGEIRDGSGAKEEESVAGGRRRFNGGGALATGLGHRHGRLGEGEKKLPASNLWARVICARRGVTRRT